MKRIACLVKADKFELADDFLEKKRLTGITLQAVTDMEGVLRRFFQYYDGELTDETRLKKAILEYLVNKRADHYNKTMQVLRQYFSHCIEEGVINDNPCKGLKFKPQASRIVEHDEQTIKALLNLPDKRTFVGLRDATYFMLLVDTGIRPHEALRLRIGDWQDNYIKVRPEVSKTRKERYLPLSAPSIQLIKRLVRARHESWDNESGYIFCSVSGSNMTTRTVQLRFREYSKRLGIAVHPYDLRHCFALFFLRNGGNVFALSRLLGHSTLTMTQKYLALVEADLKAQHSKASPLNTLLTEKHRVGKIRR
jgi:site-specific recombinase XerD